MTPLQFQAKTGRALFALHHPGATPGGAAVLLCPPFGQESIRSHRLFRVLAERLARTGRAVLRFDYFGTGDSMGDDLDGDLVGWCEDVLAAHRELVRLSGAVSVTWVGLRLGATLAALAAQQPPPELRRLALCAPVLDGVAYLAALRQRHVQVVESLLSLPPDPRPSEVALRDAAAYTSEALGYGLSPRLREQLLALRLDPLRRSGDVEVVWMRDGGDASQPAPGATSPGTQVWPMEEGSDWMADTPDNGTLIPARLMMQIMRSVEAVA